MEGAVSFSSGLLSRAVSFSSGLLSRAVSFSSGLLSRAVSFSIGSMSRAVPVLTVRLFQFLVDLNKLYIFFELKLYLPSSSLSLAAHPYVL